jgi:Icc-related predicted phosphoesterase
MKVAHVSDNHSNAELVYQIGKSDAEILIWTGDSLDNVGRVGYGHRISPPVEREYQLSALMRMGKRLQEALQGRPVVFVRGNHDFIPFESRMRSFGIDFYELSDGCRFVDIMGKRFAGFRHIPWMDGEWSGEAHEDELESLVEQTLQSEPDVLVTHAPPYGILDGYGDEHWGIQSLPIYLTYHPHKVTHHFFGHIHECGGMFREEVGVKFINGACKFREHII